MKYYIVSGNLKAIVDRQTPREAAKFCLDKFGVAKNLECNVRVKELGFDAHTVATFNAASLLGITLEDDDSKTN